MTWATKLSYIPQIICWVWVYTQCNKLSQIEQLTSKVSAHIQCYLIHLVKLHFTEHVQGSEVERLGHHLPTNLSYIGQLICCVWAYTQCDKLSQIEQIIIKIWVQTQCKRIHLQKRHFTVQTRITGRHYFFMS